MNKIIIPTGYMGSGSSAITDLVSEFEGYVANQGSYEYVFMHCPNGIFDLEDKLLLNNNAVRSDEAFHSFLKTMNQLYDKKYWWVGHYKEVMGEEFWCYTKEYVEELVQFKPDFYWYYQENADAKMILKLILRRVVKLVTLGRVLTKKPLIYSDMMISYLEPDEFYSITKKYLSKIWKMLGLEERNIILDQLILPFNIHRMDRYFEGNTHTFVVERDPRDVFISNKYVWPGRDEPVPYPIDAKEFCLFYKKLRKQENISENPNVCRVKFEDLIYDYDRTVKKIMDHLGLKDENHLLKKKRFDPERSINNTQLFLSAQFKDEVKIIENELQQYLYRFPYERETNTSKVF